MGKTIKRLTFNELPIQIKFAVSQINKFPKNRKYRLLDVGAGYMYLRDYLGDNFIYESLDYKTWENWEKPNYTFNLDTLSTKKLPIKNRVYDVIVCLDTLEHTLYPNKIMDELLRVAKKDAFFVLSMPNEYNLYSRLSYLFGKKLKCSEAFETINKHQHIHVPRVKDILKFFSKFVIIKRVGYGWHSRIVMWDKGFKRTVLIPIDYIFKFLSNIYPNLFCRTVGVIGIKK